MVAVAAQGEEGSPARNALPWLAERHSRRDLDIRPELYDLWIDCLVETARAHDPEFGPEVESAWRETLTVGANYMRERYMRTVILRGRRPDSGQTVNKMEQGL